MLPPALAGEAGEPSERAARARKIKPQLAEGPLVKVAGAHHQAEAEFVQSLLLEAGVPSTLRRTRGFDVPDLMAAGPRDVLVPQSGAEVAREVLLQADLGPLLPAGPVDRPSRVLLGLLVALVVVALVIWLVGRAVG